MDEAGVPAEALPTINFYEQLVGPFYDTASLALWRGVTRQAIDKAVSAGAVIACRVESGQWVYPMWQFTETRTVHPHLISLWSVLRTAGDPWTCAVWLRSPQSEFGDRSAVDWISEGRPVDAVLAIARVDAQRWSV